jgi:hypothetical protein
MLSQYTKIPEENILAVQEEKTPAAVAAFTDIEL